jgi:hypothetical protein
MVTPAQRKGKGYEREVVKFLREAGVSIYRQHDGGTDDTGDFIIGPFVVEAKAYRDTVRALREAMAESEVAAMRLPGHIPAALIKREGYGIGASYFVMSLRSLVLLMDKLREAEE